MTNAVESLVYRQNVAAGTTMDPLHERIKGPATLDKIKVRFYSGQAGCLQVRIKLKRLNGSFVDVLSYVGSVKYLSGDDDTFEIPVNMPVYNDEELVIYVQNTAVEEAGEEGEKTYTLFVIAEVDYYAGTRRVI